MRRDAENAGDIIHPVVAQIQKLGIAVDTPTIFTSSPRSEDARLPRVWQAGAALDP